MDKSQQSDTRSLDIENAHSILAKSWLLDVQAQCGDSQALTEALVEYYTECTVSGFLYAEVTMRFFDANNRSKLLGVFNGRAGGAFIGFLKSFGTTWFPSNIEDYLARKQCVFTFIQGPVVSYAAIEVREAPSRLHANYVGGSVGIGLGINVVGAGDFARS